MFQSRFLKIALYLLTSVALVIISWWLMKDPTSKFSESLPGLDKRGAADTVSENVEIGKIFEIPTDKRNSQLMFDDDRHHLQ